MIKLTRKATILALAATFLITIFLHLTFVQPYVNARSATYDYNLTYRNPSRIYPHLIVSEEGQQLKSSSDADADGVEDDEEMQFQDLHNMIMTTKGFFVRDWSLWLGWNNVRYIVEAAVLQAQLLNRTLVVPTYIYARGCEFGIETCAAYFTMVNRNDALSSDEWRELPVELQMGWKIPIRFMIDLPHLRSRHPVITVSEYLLLHGLDEDKEVSKGSWDRDVYHSSEYIFDKTEGEQNFAGDESRRKKPSLYVIHNDWYDSNIVRVDLLPDEMKIRGEYDVALQNPDKGQVGQFLNTGTGEVHDKLESSSDGRNLLEWDWAKNVLIGCGAISDEDDDDKIQRVLETNGWEVLLTYPSHAGMDYLKTVTETTRQVAPRSSIRGFREDFADVTDDVILLEGETHLERKPGQLRFTSSTARDSFTTIVLYYIISHSKVYDLASLLAKRMFEKVGHRNWMGAHMRRGDFVRYGWEMSNSLESHLERSKNRLNAGRNILEDLYNSKELKTFDIPDAQPDTSVLTVDPPRSGDPFYLATDERSPEGLTYLRENGAILLSDLLTPSDRRAFGPELLITDYIAILEQATLSLAGYFYGSAASSVSGGIINMRAVNGKDPRTSLADFTA